MSARRVAVMAGIAAFVAMTIAVGVAAPADAASSFGRLTPKQYMLNVLSSVLGQAGPDSKAKRAVIAADQQYDFSWEALEEQWKAPGGSGAPQSYDDYVVQRQEYFQKNGYTSKQGELGTDGNAKKYVRTARVPASKAISFAKNVGSVAAPAVGLFALDHRLDIANGVAGFFGIDAQGAVCSSAAGGHGFVDAITGADCDAWRLGLDAGEINADAGGGTASTEWMCTTDGACVRWSGVRFVSTEYNPSEAY